MNRILPDLQGMPIVFGLLVSLLLLLCIVLVLDLVLSFGVEFTLARAQPQPSEHALEPINTVADSLSRARDTILSLFEKILLTLVGAAAAYGKTPRENQRASSHRNS